MKEKLIKLMRLLQKIPTDKAYHALGGTIVGSIVLMIITALDTVGIDQFAWLMLYTVTMLTVGWGIELFQIYTRSGQYDNMDAIAVILGALVPALPFALLMYKGI